MNGVYTIQPNLPLPDGKARTFRTLDELCAMNWVRRYLDMYPRERCRLVQAASEPEPSVKLIAVYGDYKRWHVVGVVDRAIDDVTAWSNQRAMQDTNFAYRGARVDAA